MSKEKKDSGVFRISYVQNLERENAALKQEFNKSLGMIQKILFQLNNPQLYVIEEVITMINSFIENLEYFQQKRGEGK